jgi:hypothetical protein
LILDPTGQRFPTAIPTTSQRGNDLEINNRRYAQACDLAQVASLGNAHHDGRQDDRYDDNSDRLDKDIAQWREGCCQDRIDEPDGCPEGDADKHLSVELAAERRKPSHRPFLGADVGCSPLIRCIEDPFELNAAYKQAPFFRRTPNPDAANLRRDSALGL